MKDFSRTVVDFDQAVNELHRGLQERGTWIDTLPTNVGETILALVGGSVAASQHLGIMATRNAFLHTATRDSAIYAIVRQQGTKILRSVSAATTARLKNNYNETIFIPQYSEFKIDDTSYYNKSQLIFSPGSEQEIELTQGIVRAKVFDLDTMALDLTEFLLNEPGFAVTSDLLLFTTHKVNGTTRTWSEADGGLYNYTADDYVYFESTTASGDVSFIFGDDEYGARLPRNNVLTVRYVVSTGELANGKLSGSRARCVNFPQITGQTIAPTVGGGNVKTSDYYKSYGPYLFRSRGKAISEPEIRATASRYPGVADVAVLGQRDIAPQDKTYMNTMRICILPEQMDTWGGSNPNPKSAGWSNFVKWLKPQLHSLIEVETCNPQKVLVEVRVLIAVFNTADPEQIRLAATEAILALFKKRRGILKRRLSKSDIRKACTLDGVDYIEIESFNGEESVEINDPTSYIALKANPTVNVVYTEREQE
jgi:hypothetical protein